MSDENNDPVQARIHMEAEGAQTNCALPSPSTVETHCETEATVKSEQEITGDPVQARINYERIENPEFAHMHAQAQIARATPQTVDPNAPAGMTADALNKIAAGQPDPAAPMSPSQISPTKPMNLAEMHQFVLALEAELGHLKTRFQTLVSENFKAPY